MVEEGKIKYIGLCEASKDTLRRAHAVHTIKWSGPFGLEKLRKKFSHFAGFNLISSTQQLIIFYHKTSYIVLIFDLY